MPWTEPTRAQHAAKSPCRQQRTQPPWCTALTHRSELRASLPHLGTWADLSTKLLSQDVALHPLLAAGVDNLLLLKALRSLDARQAILLFRYLQRWLQNFAGAPTDSLCDCRLLYMRLLRQ